MVNLACYKYETSVHGMTSYNREGWVNVVDGSLPSYLSLALDFGRFMGVSWRNLEGKSKFTTPNRKDLHIRKHG
jgi:hypothetical protein